MKMLVATRNAGFAAILLAACNHSDPTGSWPAPPDGPFDDNIVPTRLTYSTGTDVWPTFSQDGSQVLYTFEKLTPDNDRCLGLLPAVGGQRTASVCDVDTSPFLRDGFEHGALSAAGVLAFTRHSGDIGGPTATGGALYVVSIDSLAGTTRVFDLKQQPAGAPRRWDYLVNPVWISENEVAFIGTQVAYIPPGPFLPEDTIYTGLDLAKVRLDGGTPQITVLADVSGATALAFDPVASRFVFLRQDSLFTVPSTGGTATFHFALPDNPGEPNLGITGVAAGGGKIWITWGSSRTTGTTSYVLTSRISEVGAGGGLTTLHARERFYADGILAQNDGTWERIAAAPDGSRLAIEGRNAPTGDDIYLLELP